MKPLDYIPDDLFDDFTLNGKVYVSYEYYDNSICDDLHNEKICLELIENAKLKKEGFYGKTDVFLYQAFSDYLKNKENILIFGSSTPWYESICSVYGIKKIIISEYKNIKCSMYQYINPEELNRLNQKFYNLLSISSFEHDGLGRYGELLNPNADIETMQKIKNYIHKDGILFLSVPIGSDVLVWNAHRIYGKIRLPMLLQGWNVIAKYGFNEEQFNLSSQCIKFTQPILVLKKE